MTEVKDLNINKQPSLADIMLKGYESDLVVKIKGKLCPVWKVIESWLWIIPKDDMGNNGKPVRLKMRYAQIRLYKAICDQKRRGKPMRQIVLKARQIGFSTIIAAIFFVLTMFGANKTCYIVANKAENTGNLFEIYSNFYKHLDDSNPYLKEIIEAENQGKRHWATRKPELAYAQNKKMFLTKYGNSKIEVLVAGDDSGRGTHCDYLHLSECAYYPQYDLTMNSVLELVSDTNINSIAFEETTGNGFNEFKDGWDYAAEGKDIFEALFVPWFENASYRVPGWDDSKKPCDMPDWVKEKQEEYKIANSQMAWFMLQYHKKHGNKKLLLQEYPFCSTDSFISTGSSKFNNDVLARRKEAVLKEKPERIGSFQYKAVFSENGEYISLEGTEFTKDIGGEWKIYEFPKDGHPYIAICDPNNGGSDFTAIQVIDNSNLHQVAVMKTESMKMDDVAYNLVSIGYMYNTALISTEMNLGKVVMDYILKMRYPAVYVNQSMRMDDWKMPVARRFGHETTRANRQYMIDEFVIAFEEDPDMIADYETLCQMETFQKVEHHSTATGKITYKDEAIRGAHDDLVMSYCAVFVVRSQQTAAITTKTRENSVFGESEYESYRRRKSDEDGFSGGLYEDIYL